MKSKVVSYGTIDCAIWTHPAFRNLSDDAKLVFVYLKTCKHQNMIGSFHCPDAYIVSDLGWDDFARLKKAKAELSRPDDPDKSFCLFCQDTQYVYLNKHLDKFPVYDINRIKGSVNIMVEMPRVCRFTARLADRMISIILDYEVSLLNKEGMDSDKRQKVMEEIKGLQGACEGLTTPSEQPPKTLGSNTATATATATAQNLPSPMDAIITKQNSLPQGEPFQ